MLATILCFGGCAAGNKYSYDSVRASLSFSGNTAVAVATYDRRLDVTTGKKSPDYVGTQRGGFGNPFDVTTASGNSLAHDMTVAMASSLAKQGFRATPIETRSSDSTAVIARNLGAAKADRLLLLTIVEWYSDTFSNIGLYYDLDLRVMEASGKVLAQRRIDGTEDLEGSFMNPPAAAKRVIPEAFKQKLEQLLNSPPIREAFR